MRVFFKDSVVIVLVILCHVYWYGVMVLHHSQCKCCAIVDSDTLYLRLIIWVVCCDDIDRHRLWCQLCRYAKLRCERDAIVCVWCFIMLMKMINMLVTTYIAASGVDHSEQSVETDIGCCMLCQPCRATVTCIVSYYWTLVYYSRLGPCR